MSVRALVIQQAWFGLQSCHVEISGTRAAANAATHGLRQSPKQASSRGSALFSNMDGEKGFDFFEHWRSIKIIPGVFNARPYKVSMSNIISGRQLRCARTLPGLTQGRIGPPRAAGRQIRQALPSRWYDKF